MRPTNTSVICCIIAGWVTGNAARTTSQRPQPCKLLNGKLDSSKAEAQASVVGTATGLGMRSGGGWDGDAPPLPAGGRCATQLDRPDRMAVAEEVEQLELERDEAQELPMPLRPESVGDGGPEEPEEHEQLSAGTAGRGRDVDGLSATRAWARALGWRSIWGPLLVF